MKPSPSMEQMTVFPQFKEYGDVLTIRPTAQNTTGRHGSRLVTKAHTFACAAFTVFAITAGLIGNVLLFHAIGLPEGRQRAIASGAGFFYLAAAVCSLIGGGAVCVHSYRKEKAQTEQARLLSQESINPLNGVDLALTH